MITTKERKYLISAMSRTLDEYGYKHTDEALNKIIDEWAAQKHDLIDAFKKHQNYVDGQFMISFVKEFNRPINSGGARDFSTWLYNNCMRRPEIQRQEIMDRREGNGDVYLPWSVWHFFRGLHYYAERCLSRSTVAELAMAIPEVKVHVGEKTTRAINRICTYLGWDKVDGYNKAFAQYADSLSSGTVKRRVVLSVNPMDYLTMSFGNSWSSCHTIDKENKRGMPNGYEGMHASGTMSYMLDQPSIVLYTIDMSDDTDDYWEKPKINRQMFHWGKEKLIQGRLYPQGNDYSGNEYACYREIVQNIIKEIFDISGDWQTDIGTSAASKYIIHEGTHYGDYYHFDNCSLSYFGEENTEKITVGAEPICVRCGKRHNDEERIDCCVVRRCKKCGCIIYDGNPFHEIDGECYCAYCVHKCDICGKYHFDRSTAIRDENIHVCDTCLREHFIDCYNCGRFMRIPSTTENNERRHCRRCQERERRLRSLIRDDFSWLDLL